MAHLQVRVGQGDRLVKQLHRLGDVALGLERHEAPVHQQVGVGGVHLHAGLVQLVCAVKLLQSEIVTCTVYSKSVHCSVQCTVYSSSARSNSCNQ